MEPILFVAATRVPFTLRIFSWRGNELQLQSKQRSDTGLVTATVAAASHFSYELLLRVDSQDDPFKRDLLKKK